MVKGKGPTRISREAFSRFVLLSFGGVKCDKAGKYIGSMLYFDFLTSKYYIYYRNRKSPAFVISIRDVFWEIYIEDNLRLSSEEVDQDSFSEMTPEIESRRFRKVIFSERAIVDFQFERDFSLKIDLTNRWGEVDRIVEVRAAGEILSISPKGYCYRWPDREIVERLP